MRSIDESFQRMVSKRYAVDFTEIKSSKSLFESLDECDKKLFKSKLYNKIKDPLKDFEFNNKLLKEDANNNLESILEKVYTKYAKNLPDAVCYEFESGNLINEILDNFDENKTGLNIDYDFIENWCKRDYGEKNWESVYDYVIEFYENLNDIALKFLNSNADLINESDEKDTKVDLGKTTPEVLDEAIIDMWKNGAEAAEYFDQLYKRGYQGNGNEAETKKAIPIYHKLCELLKCKDGTTAEEFSKLYDSANESLKKEVTALVRDALTWGNYNKALNEDEESTQNEYYDFSDELWNKLPHEVKISMNDAWDNNKTNINFFEPYLKALVDAKVITEDEKAEFIKSNDSYGYKD